MSSLPRATGPGAEPRGRSSLAVQCLVYLSFGAPIGMLGAGWPDARDRFGAATGALGVVAAGYGLGRLVTSAAALPILRRWHIRTATAALALALAATCTAIAVTRDLLVLVAAFAALGTISGLLDALGNRYQSVVRDVASAGLMFGSYGIGSTLGPALVAVASWPTAYLGAAAIAVAAAVVSMGRSVRWPDALDQPEPPRRAARQARVPVRILLVSLAVFAVYVTIEVTTANWAASYLEEERGLSGSGAAWAMSGFWAGITIGRLALGRLAVAGRGLRPGQLIALSASAVAVLFVAVGFVPVVVSTGLLALAGLALAPMFPTLMSTTADRVGVAAAGRVTGWQLLTANLSATVVSLLVGAGVDDLGAGLPAVVLAVLAVAGLPLALHASHLHPDDGSPSTTGEGGSAC